VISFEQSRSEVVIPAEAQRKAGIQYPLHHFEPQTHAFTGFLPSQE
jgi:hypothetical protein